MRLEAIETKLAECLGRTPSRDEWAKEAGMKPGELDRALTQGRSCKQRMMSSNMGLVISVARKYSTWGLALEEILTVCAHPLSSELVFASVFVSNAGVSPNRCKGCLASNRHCPKFTAMCGRIGDIGPNSP